MGRFLALEPTITAIGSDTLQSPQCDIATGALLNAAQAELHQRDRQGIKVD